MTSSSSIINYSVRQNKTIERALVFEGLRKLANVAPWDDCVYVGLGSAWFVDFDLAHRELGIQTMISLEADEITYKRALFNRPFRTVEVVPGYSHDEIPELLLRSDLDNRPWIVWLDYDQQLDDTKLDELKTLVRDLPKNSALLVTFNAHTNNYGDSNGERLEEFEGLFGAAFPSEKHEGGRGLNKFATVQQLLAGSLLDVLDSEVRSNARPGSLHRCFDLRYQDGAPMVTVGVMLADDDCTAAVDRVVGASEWRGIAPDAIESPPLTPKEVAALRTLMPADSLPQRADVQSLGFDLEEGQLASFARYYLDYPSWVQAAR